MRRALLIGIDDYTDAPLAGCVNDARRLGAILERHHDGAPNFECRRLLSDDERITRSALREAINSLFAQSADLALLFFAGHGTYNNLGGHLVTQDAAEYDEGVPMMDILTLIRRSPVKEVVVLLDCCHSGALGSVPPVDPDANSASIREGVTILAASRGSETAAESNGGGIFTSLICDALDGSAADVCGRVTTASIYAYVDQALGAWEQRPLFKAHVSSLTALRNAPPAVSLDTLRLLPRYFPNATYEFPLDRSYEPTAEPRNAEREQIFRHLQQYRDAGLVRPNGADHMYDAAMESKSCRLTGLGRHYWELASRGKL